MPRSMLRRRLSLRQLELLAALDRARSLSAAAREVHISQPAASRLVKAAAADLDIELFVRAGRRLEPTSAGRVLMQRAARLVGDLDRVAADLAAIRQGRIGATSLGAGVGASYALVPNAVASLLDHAPGISVSIREGPIDDLLARLDDGRLELVVGRIEPERVGDDMEITELYDPPLRIVAGPHHPLAGKRRLEWRTLLSQAWIVPEAGTPMRTWVERAFRRAGGRPQAIQVESSAIPANVALLNRRDLLWPVSADIAAGFVAAGVLRELPVVDAGGSGSLVVVRVRSRPLSPGGQRLLDCMLLAARQHRHPAPAAPFKRATRRSILWTLRNTP